MSPYSVRRGYSEAAVMGSTGPAGSTWRGLMRGSTEMSMSASGGGEKERWKREKNVAVEDILIDGVPRGQELHDFYRGLALKLAQKLSLARTESIRYAGLGNERQTHTSRRSACGTTHTWCAAGSQCVRPVCCTAGTSSSKAGVRASVGTASRAA